jgi:hypothetical protein
VTPDPDAPYDVAQLDCHDEWLETMFRWRERDDGWLLEGTCPRCGHDTDKIFSPLVVSRFEHQPSKKDVAVVRCNCTQDHTGREGGQGCGAWWGLEFIGGPQ